LPIANFRLVIAARRNTNRQLAFGNWQCLLGFLVTCVLTATSTKLGKLQPIGRGLLVLGRYVVAVLAFTTLEHNVIARHNLSYFRLPISNCRLLAGR
jgi:hypothetical protein